MNHRRILTIFTALAVLCLVAAGAASAAPFWDRPPLPWP